MISYLFQDFYKSRNRCLCLHAPEPLCAVSGNALLISSHILPYPQQQGHFSCTSQASAVRVRIQSSRSASLFFSIKRIKRLVFDDIWFCLLSCYSHLAKGNASMIRISLDNCLSYTYASHYSTITSSYRFIATKPSNGSI